MDSITPEIKEHIELLCERLRDTNFGDVGIVFTLRDGKISLIKEINQPIYRLGERIGKP